MATIQATTPEQARSPQKHTLTITEAQKQALIDNLQLEVTERARKLRAQYALQAQGLRTRLEMRINRIPQNLRKVKMQDLVEKHTQQNKPAPAPALAVNHHQQNHHHTASQVASPAKHRGTKRTSDDVPIASDKENASPRHHPLSNPKKRSKPNPPVPSNLSQPQSGIPSSPATTRTIRAAPASTIKRIPAPAPIAILSPKSHNSRIAANTSNNSSNRSPMKSPPGALKSPYPRPATATATHVTRPTTRPASRLGLMKQRPGTALGLSPERPPTRTRKARGSSASDSSVGTTIVRTTAAKKPTFAPTTTTITTGSKASNTKATKASAAATVAPVAPAPAPAPAAAAPPVKETTKRSGIKNAFSSLTGSKRGKTAAAAAAAAVAANQAASAAPATGGRVLRKRA